jgi:hypothetical protein
MDIKLRYAIPLIILASLPLVFAVGNLASTAALYAAVPAKQMSLQDKIRANAVGTPDPHFNDPTGIFRRILGPSHDVLIDPKTFPKLTTDACSTAKWDYDHYKWREHKNYEHGSLFDPRGCKIMQIAGDPTDTDAETAGVYYSVDFIAWDGPVEWTVEWDLRSKDGIHWDSDFSNGTEGRPRMATAEK